MNSDSKFTPMRQLFLSFVCCLLVTFSASAQTIQISEALRLVNEQSCNGYAAPISLSGNKVSSYLKKELGSYGKNEGKKNTYVYREAKVVGMTELVTIYAQIDKKGKESAELWLGILSDANESHPEAQKMLYDIVLHIYLAEADNKIAKAQRDYDRSLNKGIILSDKLQTNKTDKIKLEADLEKNAHDSEKLLQRVTHAKEKTERLKTALNNVLSNSRNEDAIEKAQKHYDKAASHMSKLEKNYSNSLSTKQKLEQKLANNAQEKIEIEAEIVENQSEQTQLKTVLENAKQARSLIK